MIDAGLPLVQCLEILGSQEEDANFAAVILQTRSDIESGASLADSMRKHPKTFDPLFTNMIAAGEAGGILDTILKRLATYIEKSVKPGKPEKEPKFGASDLRQVTLEQLPAECKTVLNGKGTELTDVERTGLPAAADAKPTADTKSTADAQPTADAKPTAEAKPTADAQPAAASAKQ